VEAARPEVHPKAARAEEAAAGTVTFATRFVAVISRMATVRAASMFVSMHH